MISVPHDGFDLFSKCGKIVTGYNVEEHVMQSLDFQVINYLFAYYFIDWGQSFVT